jgi:Leucine-rich repeat (LRR) protein
MVGRIPDAISQLSDLRMIELATMPQLAGVLPNSLCTLINLRRLCICRCGLKGRIPDQIGQLQHLEELQLFGNELVGKVPDSISKLSSLRLLSLGEYTGGNNFGKGFIVSVFPILAHFFIFT